MSALRGILLIPLFPFRVFDRSSLERGRAASSPDCALSLLYFLMRRGIVMHIFVDGGLEDFV